MLTKSALLLGAVCASAVNYAASVSVSALYPHVPLVFWSNQALFNARDAYLNSVFDDKEVAFVLKNVATRDTDKDFYNVLNHEPVILKRPEALCVFVQRSLQTDQLSQFYRLKETVKSSVSSVIVPHTTRTESLEASLDKLKDVKISINGVQDWITSNQGVNILNNDETDIIVIEIPESYTAAEADEKIDAAAEALSSAADGLVDFAFTGLEGTPVYVEDPYARRRLASTTDIVCDAGYLVGLSSTGKAFCFSHYVHMTPEILTALIFGFFFIFLAYVGISVLHAIQTPLRYPHHGPPKGKEF